jgi:hypothetical protein
MRRRDPPPSILSRIEHARWGGREEEEEEEEEEVTAVNEVDAERHRATPA